MGTVAQQAGATARGKLNGLLDQFLDPVTLDYVDTENGEWLETADSRTMVMIQLEMRFGRDIIAPGDGTRVKDELENDAGDPVTPDFVLAETLRSLQLLVDAGVIQNLNATVRDEKGQILVDETGRLMVRVAWYDPASSSPIDLFYTPFQG